jgi:hypothetical protein
LSTKPQVRGGFERGREMSRNVVFRFLLTALGHVRSWASRSRNSRNPGGPSTTRSAAASSGPVAAVIAVDDDDQAASIANATRYGLAASVWSGNPDRALALGHRITSGALFVNAVVSSDPRLPFGGTKHSGYGRELGLVGATEFTNIRTYVVGTGPPPSGPATE